MRTVALLLSLFAAALLTNGCVLALPGYNDPFNEKLRVVGDAPSQFDVSIEGSDLGQLAVPEDGRLLLEFPVLPRECSTYFLGIRVEDRSVTGRKLIHISRDGRVVKKLSVNKLRKLPVDASGYHLLRMR
jgi:hypothetical protein